MNTLNLKLIDRGYYFSYYNELSAAVPINSWR